MADKFFWADETAERIIKEKGEKGLYVCASGITPSGKVHIGNFREVITTEMVVRALRDKGKNVRFIYSWDDFDRFRKVPSGVDMKYEKYLGQAISDIPSPFDSNLSYAKYNENQFENSLGKVFVEPEFIYQNEMNKKCAYAELIKIALDKKDEIKEILNKFRKEPLSDNWYPVMIYCENCKKDHTKINGIDGYDVSYKCECGHEDKIDIRKSGLVSIRWRVDWPLRWKYEGVDFEPGGIDHSVYGGSYTTAKEISKKIFDFEPPVYQLYEWITVKGTRQKDFHSSKGSVLTLEEVSEIYEPAVLRYLFVGTKPRSAFEISFDNDAINNYEKFDTLEKKYFEGKCNGKERRMYEMSVVKIPEKMPERIGFRGLITMVQVGKTEDLNEYDKIRYDKVRNWLDKYAEDDMKFEIKENVSGEFSEKEKEALIELKKTLKEIEFGEGELFDRFYQICDKVGISNTEFFDASYRALIGKAKGPRLASLIKSVGQEKIIRILETLS